MFLTQEPYNVEDFLKSVNFVAPQGMNLKYFIVPVDAATHQLKMAANEQGFEPNQELNVPGVTDTITYTKRQALDRNAMATSNFDPAMRPSAYPTHIENPRPQTPEENILMNGGRVSSPVRGILVSESKEYKSCCHLIESSKNAKTIILTKRVGIFPKNTLFNFVREA